MPDPIPFPTRSTTAAAGDAAGEARFGPHFTVAELVHSDVAVAEGIVNVASAAIVLSLAGLVENVLEPVRAKFGAVYILSGYRCPELNAKVGGVPDSQHLRGEAADITCPAVDNFALASWIERTLQVDQVILEGHRAGAPRSGWVHVSWKAGPLRHQALTMHAGGYLPGLRNDFA